MKYILILFLATASIVAVNAQNRPGGFLIKGTFDKSIQTDSVFLFISLDEIIASAPVVNGQFELKGTVSEPEKASFVINKNGIKYNSGDLILENADYTFWRKDNSIKIKGGKLHDMVLGFESSDEYQKAVNDFNATCDRFLVNEKTADDFTPEELAIIAEKEGAALGMESGYLANIINNPQAPVLAKVFAVDRIQDWKKYPVEKRIELLNGYAADPKIAASKILNSLKEEYEEELNRAVVVQTVSAGKPFKDIEAKDVNGKTVKLSEVVAKNKFTILEFWASWCGPCRGEIPNLKKAYAKYKSKGLEIYSISLDEDGKKWLTALEEEGNPSWLNVIDKAAFGGKSVKAYGLSGVPASYLISQDGKILVSDEKLRGKELDETLSKYMP